MTALEICNLALSSLGNEVPIAALTETSKPARLCAQWLPIARRSVLSATYWAGLTKDPPAMPGMACGDGCVLFSYHFPFATDALRLKAKTPDGREADLDITEHAVLSSEPFLKFTYVEDCEDAELWPPCIQEAVIHELAARIAPSLCSQRSRTADAKENARETLSLAKAHNANLTRRHGQENRYADARTSEGWA